MIGGRRPDDDISLGVTELFNHLISTEDIIRELYNKHYRDKKKLFYRKEEASQISKKIRPYLTGLLSDLDNLDNAISND